MSELDAVIHAPARLRIMASLAALDPGDRITFRRLQELLGFTAGNLSTHLSKLEDAGYVSIEKTFDKRKPVTHVELTALGRAAYESYLMTLRAILTERTPS